jgi:hypothetical protein
LGTLSSPLALCLGSFRQVNHQQKAQQYKTMTLNIPQNRHLFTFVKKAQRHLVQSHLRMYPSGNSNFSLLFMSADDQKSTMNIDFEVRNTF